MQIILKRIPWVKILPVILALMAMAAVTDGQEKAPVIGGQIRISITYFGYKFIEFKLQDGRLLQTSEGKVIPIDKKRNISIRIDSSDDFKSLYSSERRYHYEKEDKLAAILSQYDLEELDKIGTRFFLNKGNLGQERYFLTGPGKKFKYFWGKYADHFKPNKQFSYVIYHKSYASVGALLDLKTNEISFPFGLDDIENAVWNEEGRDVAYLAPNRVVVWDKTGRYVESKKNRDDRYPSILVIKDISTGKTLLRKSLGKYVADITWAPDSSAVALLTYTERISLSPGELLAAAAGHPYPIRSFSLDVYDLSGNLTYNAKINGELKSSKGRLVWINK
jgi:hypothetical protein